MAKRLAHTTWIKLAVSFAATVGIVVRLFWPSIKIDVVALGLFVVGVLPWLSSILESAKFPGGWEVKFRDVQRAASQVTSGAELSAAPALEPSFVSIASRDPNLALVGLRIEIEKRLRELAARYDLPGRLPLRRLLQELRRHEILEPQALSGLDELVNAGDDAAHGAGVQDSIAQWAIEYGPKVLAVLDERLARA